MEAIIKGQKTELRQGNALIWGNIICIVDCIMYDGNVCIIVGRDRIAVDQLSLKPLILAESIIQKLDKEQYTVCISLGWFNDIKYAHELQNKWEDTFNTLMRIL